MATAATDDDVLEALPVVRRVVGARVRDGAVADDLVQETMARVLSARARLDAGAVRPFAIVTARNLVASLARGDDRRRRHAHRLVDLRQAPDPGDEVVGTEERASLNEALANLPGRDRDALVAHAVDGASTADLAERHGTTPGAVAVRLAAARAKLRVEYVLSLRRVRELPTPRCRPVLMALSAADTRRQRALDAGGHLLDCATCASLADPLVERRRRLAALWPFALLLRKVRERPRTSAAAGVGAAVVAGALLWPSTAPPPPPPPAPPVSAPARPEVVVEDGTVVEVPADEAFVVEVRPGERVLVRLTRTGAESLVRIRPGQHVSFTATRVGDRVEVPAGEVRLLP